jgi:hemolysin III
MISKSFRTLGAWAVQHCREPVSGFTHLAGALLGAVGLVWLVTLTWGDVPRMATMIVYGVSMVLLYSASAALHLVKGPPQLLVWLNRFDHAAIYALIAGTYTPLCYNLLTGGWRWGMLSTIWAMAAIGIVYKLSRPYWKAGHFSTLFYVGMGWLGVLLIPELIRLLPLPAIGLLAGGGLLYSAGAVIFALQKPNFHPQFGFHEVWHLFVLGGSTLHFLVVLQYIALA